MYYKKFILFFAFVMLFSLQVPKATATSIDYDAKIQFLMNQLANLKSQFLGSVSSSNNSAIVSQLQSTSSQLRSTMMEKAENRSTTQTTTTNTNTSTDQTNQTRLLQKFLNAHGFLITDKGPGSVGSETSFFGSATRRALCKFQINEGLSATSASCGSFGVWTKKIIKEKYNDSTLGN